MKIWIILFIFLLTAHLTGQAQKFHPISTDSTEWFIETWYPHGDGGPDQYGKERFFFNGDTIINNKPCVKILAEPDNSSSSYYWGCLYQDSLYHKAYLFLPGYINSIKILDLDLEPGDTISLEPYYSYNYLIVKEVDSINTNGKYRKRIIFQEQLCYGSYDYFCFIEGIGSNAGLLPHDYLGAITSLLTCFREEGESIFPVDLHPYGCDLYRLTGLDNMDIRINQFSVYPNPFIGHISLEADILNQETIVVSIYNLLGRQLVTKAFSGSNKYDIDLSFLKNGLYLMKVTRSGEKTFIKRIVKI